MKSILIILIYILSASYSLYAQNYGGADYAVDTNCYDNDYPDIEIWAEAGVTGGIPYIPEVKKTITPGDNLQDAINSINEGVILLSNGTYIINNSIKLKSKVILRGESKDDVVLSVMINSGDAIKIEGSTSYSGIENLQIIYEAIDHDPVAYRSGMNDGWYCSECFQNDEPNHDVSLIRIDGNNNWVDNVNVMKSGSDPVELSGDHNTFRNSLVENCYNKGGGGEGYFDLRGNHNLITGNTVRLIRHFAIQQKAKYNVVINNLIEVDVNFHNGDEGHQLIENNTIYRPSWHTWGVFATGGSTWGHKAPGPETIIVNNTCYDYRERRNEFDEPNVIYSFDGYGDPKKTNKKMPKCGTFYAVTERSSSTDSSGVDSKAHVEVLNPVQDAYIQGVVAYNNSLIRVESGRRVGYLKFNLTQVPSTIISAKLKLTCSGDGGSGKIIVNEGDGNNWTENNLSLSNKPSSSEVLATLNETYKIGNTYVWDLDVKEISNSDHISLILSQINGNDVAFASKENIVGKPELEITYNSLLKDANITTDLNKPLLNIKVFPNPATDELNIEAPYGSIIELYTITGKKLMQTTALSISVSEFPRGIYLVNVCFGERSIQKKVIIN